MYERKCENYLVFLFVLCLLFTHQSSSSDFSGSKNTFLGQEMNSRRTEELRNSHEEENKQEILPFYLRKTLIFSLLVSSSLHSPDATHPISNFSPRRIVCLLPQSTASSFSPPTYVASSLALLSSFIVFVSFFAVFCCESGGRNTQKMIKVNKEKTLSDKICVSHRSMMI